MKAGAAKEEDEEQGGEGKGELADVAVVEFYEKAVAEIKERKSASRQMTWKRRRMMKRNMG